MNRVYTVSEFNTEVDNLVSNTFYSVSIKGEISECKNSKIGAVYFTLCDDDSSVSCVIFKNQLSLLGFELKEGMKVVIVADASIYKKRGSFQVVVRTIKQDGIGSIIEQILKNAEKWKTTYFAREKRSIPKGIKNLFVVTSSTGDVIHDIIRTRNLRDSAVNIFIFPCLVQGQGCVASVSSMVRYANFAMKRVVDNPELNKYDLSFENTVLIVARGGGSFDDLLPFNDEEIVKSFSESQLIIVSAIGHEQNRPLCNYAADVYVSTPTQSVEVSVFDKEAERRHFYSLINTLSRNVNRLFQYNMQNFDNLRQILDMSLENIKARVEKKLSILNNRLYSALVDKHRIEKDRFLYCIDTIRDSVALKFEKEKMRFEHSKLSLEHISPKNVMKRGYSVIESLDGKTIARSGDLSSGDIDVIFYDKKIRAHIEVEN